MPIQSPMTSDLRLHVIQINRETPWYPWKLYGYGRVDLGCGWEERWFRLGPWHFAATLWDDSVVMRDRDIRGSGAPYFVGLKLGLFFD